MLQPEIVAMSLWCYNPRKRHIILHTIVDGYRDGAIRLRNDHIPPPFNSVQSPSLVLRRRRQRPLLITQ